MSSDPYLSLALPDYDVEDPHRSNHLPTYTPALPTPRYTAHPQSSEARLHLAARLPQSTTEDSNHVFTERTKHFSVTFTNQPPARTRPTYGRGTAIQGIIGVFKPEDVASVVLKFEAKMFYSITTETGSGENDTCLFEEELKVFPRSDLASPSPPATRRQSSFFSRGSTSSQQSSEVCPHELPFSLRIPFSYMYDGTSYFPPPTYSVEVSHRNGASVKVRYHFKVVVTRRGSLVDRKASISIPIVYVPRSRPPKPITDIRPEDWKVVCTQSGIQKRFSSNIDVVQAFLALPSCQIYPIDTKIPFYLQLWSLSPSTLAMYTKVPPTLGRSQAGDDSSTAAQIEVVVLRNIKVEMLQRTLKFYQTLATGSIRRCEHEIRPTVRRAIELAQASKGWSRALSIENGNGCMSWEGELVVAASGPLWGGCAGFVAPNVFVRDLIGLRIVPPRYKDYPLKRIEHFIPIRLTTDPYGDELVHGMEIVQSPTP